MSAIDWSKAPADATHFSPAYGYFVDLWAKKDGDTWMYCAMLDGSSWYHGWDPANGEVYISRPMEWTGEGLPPVGTVCEVRTCTHKYSERFNGQIVTIVAHHQDDEGCKVAVFAAENNEYHGLVAERFYPIRTAEQISAEEREKGIQEIRDLFADGRGTDYATFIYDAGYRKQEQK